MLLSTGDFIPLSTLVFALTRQCCFASEREHCDHSLFLSFYTRVGVKVKKKSKPCEILGLKPYITSSKNHCLLSIHQIISCMHISGSDWISRVASLVLAWATVAFQSGLDYPTLICDVNTGPRLRLPLVANF